MTEHHEITEEQFLYALEGCKRPLYFSWGPNDPGEPEDLDLPCCNIPVRPQHIPITENVEKAVLLRYEHDVFVAFCNDRDGDHFNELSVPRPDLLVYPEVQKAALRTMGLPGTYNSKTKLIRHRPSNNAVTFCEAIASAVAYTTLGRNSHRQEDFTTLSSEEREYAEAGVQVTPASVAPLVTLPVADWLDFATKKEWQTLTSGPRASSKTCLENADTVVWTRNTKERRSVVFHTSYYTSEETKMHDDPKDWIETSLYDDIRKVVLFRVFEGPFGDDCDEDMEHAGYCTCPATPKPFLLGKRDSEVFKKTVEEDHRFFVGAMTATMEMWSKNEDGKAVCEAEVEVYRSDCTAGPPDEPSAPSPWFIEQADLFCPQDVWNGYLDTPLQPLPIKLNAVHEAIKLARNELLWARFEDFMSSRDYEQAQHSARNFEERQNDAFHRLLESHDAVDTADANQSSTSAPSAQAADTAASGPGTGVPVIS